jgi:hypothetical protein
VPAEKVQKLPSQNEFIKFRNFEGDERGKSEDRVSLAAPPFVSCPLFGHSHCIHQFGQMKNKQISWLVGGGAPIQFIKHQRGVYLSNGLKLCSKLFQNVPKILKIIHKYISIQPHFGIGIIIPPPPPSHHICPFHAFYYIS